MLTSNKLVTTSYNEIHRDSNELLFKQKKRKNTHTFNVAFSTKGMFFTQGKPTYVSFMTQVPTEKNMMN